MRSPESLQRLPPPTRRRVGGAGVEISLLDYGGEDDSRAPLLLLHGIRDLALSMDSIAQAFRDDFRVLALDLRGHGDSAKPGIYTFPHYLADLHLILTELALESPILLGHSLGGQIVTQYAGIYPSRARAVVTIEGLGPPTPPPQPGKEAQQDIRSKIDMLADMHARRRRMADLEEAVDRVLSKHPALDPRRARLLVEEGTMPHPEGGLAWKWDPQVQSTWASLSREEGEDRWSWYDGPVLVVTAGRSATFWRDRRRRPGSGDLHPDELARRLARFRRAQHVEISTAGHMVHFDAPEELNRLLGRFFAELAE